MAFSNQVNLSSYMNDVRKKSTPAKASDDRAHNAREVVQDMNRVKSVARSQGTTTGFKDHASNRVDYHKINGVVQTARPNSSVKKNPIKKKTSIPKG